MKKSGAPPQHRHRWASGIFGGDERDRCCCRAARGWRSDSTTAQRIRISRFGDENGRWVAFEVWRRCRSSAQFTPRCTTNSIRSAISSRGKSTSRDALLPWPSGALSRHRSPLARRGSRLRVGLAAVTLTRRANGCLFVWGSEGEDEPAFDSIDHLNWVLGLVMEHYNDVARTLIERPDRCGQAVRRRQAGTTRSSGRSGLLASRRQSNCGRRLGRNSLPLTTSGTGDVRPPTRSPMSTAATLRFTPKQLEALTAAARRIRSAHGFGRHRRHHRGLDRV